jgi:site-specific DNA-methyltransferase (adenine-specific)
VVYEFFRILKKGGIVVWLVGDETKNYSESGTSFRQALNFINIGFKLYDTMIYKKLNPKPYNHRRYEQCFEYMFIFSKGKPETVNLISEDCKSKGIFQNTNTYIHDRGDIYSERHKKGIILDRKIKSNIWEYTVGNSEVFKNIVKREHPAIFPIKLAIDHILSWSNKNDIILDAFIGSGTTSIACILTDRNYIGFDVNNDYCKNAKECIEEINKKIKNEDCSLLEVNDYIKNITIK